jgi:hypothetical protein
MKGYAASAEEGYFSLCQGLHRFGGSADNEASAGGAAV